MADLPFMRSATGRLSITVSFGPPPPAPPPSPSPLPVFHWLVHVPQKAMPESQRTPKGLLVIFRLKMYSGHQAVDVSISLMLFCLLIQLSQTLLL